LARTATRRIVLASLYIGTGNLEQELVTYFNFPEVVKLLLLTAVKLESQLISDF